MIYVLGGGSGGESFQYGFWRISFPAESSCSITNAAGTKTIDAPADAVSVGRYTFPLPSSGKWTATCSDGHGKTATKDITFSSVYNYANSTLVYGLELFDGSDFLADMGAQKKITNTDNVGHFTVDDGFLDVNQTGGINLARDIVYSFQSPVSFSGLSKLYVDFESPNSPTECYVGISSSNTTDAFNASVSPANDHSRSTLNFGLSSYQSSNYYLKFKARAVADQGGQTISRMKVYRVWAE